MGTGHKAPLRFFLLEPSKLKTPGARNCRRAVGLFPGKPVFYFTHTRRISASAYLRSLGLDFTLHSRADVETAISLTKVGANQGRLGGLLKKLITIAEDTGRMRAEEIRPLLHDIEKEQHVIKDLVSVLRNHRKC